MKRVFSFVILMLILLADGSFSLPRFALMTGAKCGSCHVNPTGGQMRNEYGVNFSLDKLPLESLKDSDFTFSGMLNDNISIGGDYRSQFIYDGFSKKTAFNAMTAAIYGVVKLSKKFTFYFKQDIVNGTYGGMYGGYLGGTEAFGLAKILPGGYIKGGVFLPDYGLRYDDHTAYTRGGDLGYTGAGFHPGLIFTPNYKDIGVEVGFNVGDLMITSGLFDGSGHTDPISFSQDKAYVAKITYQGSASDINYFLAASGYGYLSYKMGGVSLGFGGSDFVFLGEVDWTHEQLNISQPIDARPIVNAGFNSMAVLAEAGYRAIQGVWLIGRFEMFDPQQGRTDDPAGDPLNSIKRVTAGFEFFPYSFVEVRPQYRFVIETPNINNDVALAQVHLWF